MRARDGLDRHEQFAVRIESGGGVGKCFACKPEYEML